MYLCIFIDPCCLSHKTVISFGLFMPKAVVASYAMKHLHLIETPDLDFETAGNFY